jgi:ferritin-like metal-binding protein YciE
MAKKELQEKAKKESNDSNQDDNISKTSFPKNNHEKTPLYDFFLSGLKDILYAENKLVEALQEMEQAATTEELKDAFEDHYLLTKKHVSRLKKIFEKLGEKEESKECKAMDGLIEEAREIIKSTEEGSATRDVALIIAAQKVEHYEIATYGGLAQIAITLGFDKVADILEKTLQEEEETDDTLTYIAESHINPEAEKED